MDSQTVIQHFHRKVYSVVDKCLTFLPGLEMFKSNLKVGSFSKVRIAGLLESGHLVGVAPGGARECLFDYDCQVLWKKRYNDPNNLIIQFLSNVFMVHLLGSDSQRWRI